MIDSRMTIKYYKLDSYIYLSSLFLLLLFTVNISLDSFCVHIGCPCHFGKKSFILSFRIVQYSVNVGQSTAAVICSVLKQGLNLLQLLFNTSIRICLLEEGCP